MSFMRLGMRANDNKGEEVWDGGLLGLAFGLWALAFVHGDYSLLDFTKYKVRSTKAKGQRPKAEGQRPKPQNTEHKAQNPRYAFSLLRASIASLS
jgi:hypothetical protein